MKLKKNLFSKNFNNRPNNNSLIGLAIISYLIFERKVIKKQ